MKRGFTLIELLVVIAIISVLASTVMISLKQARDKGRYAGVVSQLVEASKAVEVYYFDNGVYPNDVGPGTNPPGLIPDYLAEWPDPPCSGWSYDWQNWNGGNNILISVYKPNPLGGWIVVGQECVYQTAAHSCTDIGTWINKSISCD